MPQPLIFDPDKEVKPLLGITSGLDFSEHMRTQLSGVASNSFAFSEVIRGFHVPTFASLQTPSLALGNVIKSLEESIRPISANQVIAQSGFLSSLNNGAYTKILDQHRLQRAEFDIAVRRLVGLPVTRIPGFSVSDNVSTSTGIVNRGKVNVNYKDLQESRTDSGRPDFDHWETVENLVNKSAHIHERIIGHRPKAVDFYDYFSNRLVTERKHQKRLTENELMQYLSDYCIQQVREEDKVWYPFYVPYEAERIKITTSQESFIPSVPQLALFYAYRHASGESDFNTHHRGKMHAMKDVCEPFGYSFKHFQATYNPLQKYAARINANLHNIERVLIMLKPYPKAYALALEEHKTIILKKR